MSDTKISPENLSIPDTVLEKLDSDIISLIDPSIPLEDPRLEQMAIFVQLWEQIPSMAAARRRVLENKLLSFAALDLACEIIGATALAKSSAPVADAMVKGELVFAENMKFRAARSSEILDSVSKVKADIIKLRTLVSWPKDE